MGMSIFTASAVTDFTHRLIGAMVLDRGTYEEIEADKTATAQAMAVVLLSSLATGIGSAGLGPPMVTRIVVMTVAAVMAWAAWALVTLQIGGRLLPEPQTRVDVGELLRTTGFAAAPGMLRVLGVLPSVTTPVFALTAVWMLLSMVVAVRQALDYTSTARAIAVCGLGWALSIAIALALGLLLGPTVS